MAVHGVLQWLRLLASATGPARPDHELVRRFVEAGDQAAFTILVQRHGPMVYGVCQRLLDQGQDAEDAFQATFLVFARKARSIRKQASVSCWLYGVASRVAANLRRKTVRDRRLVTAQIAVPPVAESEVSWRDVRAVLDEELAKLPERLRLPIVLCYLDGKTRDEAAQELAVSESTLRGRLERGRDLLRGRLTSRGVTLSAGLLASLLTENAASALPASLVAGTVSAALALAAGQPLASVVSAKVALLVEGVLQMMWYSKAKMALIALLAVALTGSGVGWAMHRALAEGGPELAQAQPKQKAKPPGDANADNAALRAEVAKLRAELEEARKEVKELKDGRDGKAPKKGDALYRGKPLAFYLEQYKDLDPSFRGPAIEIIGVFAEQDNALIPFLVAALKDNGLYEIGQGEARRSEYVGQAASDALANLGADAETPLLDLIQQKAPRSARMRAASALAQMKLEPKRTMPVLLKALKDDLDAPSISYYDEWGLRQGLVKALASMGQDAKPALPVVARTFLRTIEELEKYAAKQGKSIVEYSQSGDQAHTSMLGSIKTIDPEIETLLPSKRELGIGVPFSSGKSSDYSFLPKGSKTPKTKVAARPPAEEILAAWEKVGEVLKSRYLTAK